MLSCAHRNGLIDCHRIPVGDGVNLCHDLMCSLRRTYKVKISRAMRDWKVLWGDAYTWRQVFEPRGDSDIGRIGEHGLTHDALLGRDSMLL